MTLSRTVMLLKIVVSPASSPLLPESAASAKVGGWWQPAHPAPPWFGGDVNSCLPRFSSAVKFGNGAPGPGTCARPVSKRLFTLSMLRTNCANARWIRSSVIVASPKASSNNSG